MAKGAAKGTINSINPIRMAEGLIFLGKAIVEATETAMLGVLANCPLEGLKSIPSIGKKVQNFQDNANKLFLERLNTLKDSTSALATQLKLAYKNSTRDQLLENGTAIIVETLLTGKVQKCYYKFLKNQVPKIANFAKRVAEAKRIEDVVITTAEGIELTLTAGTVEMLEEENVVANALEQNANQNITRQSTNPYEEEVEKFSRFLDEKIVSNAITKHGESILATDQGHLGNLQRNGFVGNTIKLSKKYWGHIFGQDCKVVRRTPSGAINMTKDGCHIKENLKNLNLQDIRIDQSKGIFGKIKVRRWRFDRATNQGGFVTEPITKSLFPWPKEMVANKIIESLTNSKYFIRISTEGNRIILIVEIDGVQIQHIINKSGELITSYPVLD